MDNIVIIGASGHAKVVIDIIEQQKKYRIVGLIDSFKDKDTTLYEYAVLGTEHDIPTLQKEYKISGGIIAIGDNCTRLKMQSKITAIAPTFNFYTAIHPNAVIGKNVTINNGTVVMAGVIINSDASIGSHCIINTKSSVGHDVIVNDFSSIAPGVSIGGETIIGTCTAISIGCSILERITIGDNCVIGAGSVVNKNIDNNILAFGIPARKIKSRDHKEKYLKGSNN